MPLRYWALIFLLAMGWGSSFFFTEILLRELGPMMASLGRVGFGALGCWLWIMLRGKSVRVHRGMIGLLVVFGLFQYAFPLTIYPMTQQFITSSAAGIVNAMTPIMVVIVSHFWPDGERATLAKTIGVCFGFAGILIIAWPALQGQGESDPMALFVAILAPICYGIAINLLRGLAGLSRVSMTAWSLTIATMVVAPVALSIEGVPVITRAETWASLLTVGFLLTSAAFILLFWLVPRVGTTNASTATFIAPVASVVLGVVFLGEVILPIQYLGMVVIALGLVFIDGRLLRRFGIFNQSVK